MEHEHPLDALIWDTETWVAELLALLDAIEVQEAVREELACEMWEVL